MKTFYYVFIVVIILIGLTFCQFWTDSNSVNASSNGDMFWLDCATINQIYNCDTCNRFIDWHTVPSNLIDK